MRVSLPKALVLLVPGLAAAACASAPGAGPVGADTGSNLAPPAFRPYAADGRSVDALEPERYLGLWYEIATTPSFIQANCHGTTAEYGLVDADTVSVYNRCRLGSLAGEPTEIRGTADFVDASYARLRVDFGFGAPAPYDVVELDGAPGEAPYAFAAVSSAGAQLWILARSPAIDPDLYDALVARLRAQGLDADALVPTAHAPE